MTSRTGPSCEHSERVRSLAKRMVTFRHLLGVTARVALEWTDPRCGDHEHSSYVSGAAAARPPQFELRHDWKRDEVAEIYRTPLTELVFRAQSVHRQSHAPDRVQTCQLISIKTGGCPEDCAYCPQSAHYDAPVERQGLLDRAACDWSGAGGGGARSDAILHGGGVAAGSGGRGVRARAGNGARGFGVGDGSLLHVGDVERGPGGAAEGSGTDRL